MYIINYICGSRTGNRSINQDNYICEKNFQNIDSETHLLKGSFSSLKTGLLGVFDGLGGESCGEAASYIAAKAASLINIDGNSEKILSDYCYKANDEICDYAAKNHLNSMGTTAALLAFDESGIKLCNIGDSKIYLFNGALKQLSKDHLSPTPFGIKPSLYQNLGIPSNEARIKPYQTSEKYNDDDIYLICSDGLTDMVSEDEIVNVLKAYPLQDAAEQLMNEALRKGSNDNITVILARISENTDTEE